MAKKVKVSVKPTKAGVKAKTLSAKDLDKESAKSNKGKLYKPKARLTAHVKRKKNG